MYFTFFHKNAFLKLFLIFSTPMPHMSIVETLNHHGDSSLKSVIWSDERSKRFNEQTANSAYL